MYAAANTYIKQLEVDVFHHFAVASLTFSIESRPAPRADREVFDLSRAQRCKE